MLDNAVQPILPLGGACHRLRRQRSGGHLIFVYRDIWIFLYSGHLNLEPTASALDPGAGVSLGAGVEGVELASDSSSALLRSSSSSRTVRGRLMIYLRKMKVHHLCSVTETEFCVPDHGSQMAIMAKFRAFMQNPDLFRTTF